jgi:hypothetical protein
MRHKLCRFYQDLSLMKVILLLLKRYKLCKFCYNRSIINGTLFGKPCVSWSASRLPLQGFFFESLYFALCTRGLQILRAGSHWLLAIYLENKVRFRLYLGFHWRDFF